MLLHCCFLAWEEKRDDVVLQKSHVEDIQGNISLIGNCWQVIVKSKEIVIQKVLLLLMEPGDTNFHSQKRVRSGCAERQSRHTSYFHRPVISMRYRHQLRHLENRENRNWISNAQHPPGLIRSSLYKSSPPAKL